jgi:hypothetical protein
VILEFKEVESRKMDDNKMWPNFLLWRVSLSSVGFTNCIQQDIYLSYNIFLK